MSLNKEKQVQDVEDNRLFDKIAKHPWRYFFGGWLITLLIVILFFELPIFIIPTKEGIKPSDWLLFWGSFFSFIGTLFLGIVAIRQNEKLTDINKGLEKLEQERFKYEKQKSFSYLRQDGFKYYNDCSVHFDAEELGFIFNFDEGAIKRNAGSDYKEMPIFIIYLKCITESPIQHIHITGYNMELDSNFGRYKINTLHDTEIQNVHVDHVDNCCMQKGDQIPFIIRFYNVKMKTDQVSQIQSLKGEVYFECSSLYNMSSFMTLKFDIGLKNHENRLPLRPLTDFSASNIKMTYGIEHNRPTDEMFLIKRL